MSAENENGSASSNGGSNGKTHHNAGKLWGKPFPKGTSGNPKGGSALQHLPIRIGRIMDRLAETDPPFAALAKRLGYDPAAITIGDLYAAAAVVNAMRGRSKYFSEINDRMEGKVARQLNIDAVVTPGSVEAARRQLGFESAIIEVECTVKPEEASSNGNGCASAHPVVGPPAPLEE